MSYNKISLKSTTRISLNDRFTVLRNEYPVPTANNVRTLQINRQQVLASRKNQRLAAQMERRPTVIAALQPKHFQVPKNRINTNEKKVFSVKQRLSAPGRLSATFVTATGTAQRGNIGLRIRGRSSFQNRRTALDSRLSTFRGRGRSMHFRGGGLRGDAAGFRGQISSGRGLGRGRGQGRGRGGFRGRIRRGT